MKKFNLNHYIYFRLTDKGKERLKNVYFSASVHAAENGLYYCQTWVFCGLFGEKMRHPGMAAEVETDVFFEEEDLKEVVP